MAEPILVAAGIGLVLLALRQQSAAPGPAPGPGPTCPLPCCPPTCPPGCRVTSGACGAFQQCPSPCCPPTCPSGCNVDCSPAGCPSPCCPPTCPSGCLIASHCPRGTCNDHVTSDLYPTYLRDGAGNMVLWDALQLIACDPSCNEYEYRDGPAIFEEPSSGARFVYAGGGRMYDLSSYLVRSVGEFVNSATPPPPSPPPGPPVCYHGATELLTRLSEPGQGSVLYLDCAAGVLVREDCTSPRPWDRLVAWDGVNWWGGMWQEFEYLGGRTVRRLVDDTSHDVTEYLYPFSRVC